MSDELVTEGVKHVAEHGATSLSSIFGVLGFQWLMGRKTEQTELAEAKAEAEAKAALERRLASLEAGQAKVLEHLTVLVAREERVRDDREELKQIRRDLDNLRAEVFALKATIATRRESEGS